MYYLSPHPLGGLSFEISDIKQRSSISTSSLIEPIFWQEKQVGTIDSFQYELVIKVDQLEEPLIISGELTKSAIKFDIRNLLILSPIQVESIEIAAIKVTFAAAMDSKSLTIKAQETVINADLQIEDKLNIESSQVTNNGLVVSGKVHLKADKVCQQGEWYVHQRTALLNDDIQINIKEFHLSSNSITAWFADSQLADVAFVVNTASYLNVTNILTLETNSVLSLPVDMNITGNISSTNARIDALHLFTKNNAIFDESFVNIFYSLETEGNECIRIQNNSKVDSKVTEINNEGGLLLANSSLVSNNFKHNTAVTVIKSKLDIDFGRSNADLALITSTLFIRRRYVTDSQAQILAVDYSLMCANTVIIEPLSNISLTENSLMKAYCIDANGKLSVEAMSGLEAEKINAGERSVVSVDHAAIWVNDFSSTGVVTGNECEFAGDQFKNNAQLNILKSQIHYKKQFHSTGSCVMNGSNLESAYLILKQFFKMIDTQFTTEITLFQGEGYLEKCTLQTKYWLIKNTGNIKTIFEECIAKSFYLRIGAQVDFINKCFITTNIFNQISGEVQFRASYLQLDQSALSKGEISFWRSSLIGPHATAYFETRCSASDQSELIFESVLLSNQVSLDHSHMSTVKDLSIVVNENEQTNTNSKKTVEIAERNVYHFNHASIETDNLYIQAQIASYRSLITALQTMAIESNGSLKLRKSGLHPVATGLKLFGKLGIEKSIIDGSHIYNSGKLTTKKSKVKLTLGYVESFIGHSQLSSANWVVEDRSVISKMKAKNSHLLSSTISFTKIATLTANKFQMDAKSFDAPKIGEITGDSLSIHADRIIFAPYNLRIQLKKLKIDATYFINHLANFNVDELELVASILLNNGIFDTKKLHAYSLLYLNYIGLMRARDELRLINVIRVNLGIEMSFRHIQDALISWNPGIVLPDIPSVKGFLHGFSLLASARIILTVVCPNLSNLWGASSLGISLCYVLGENLLHIIKDPEKAKQTFCNMLSLLAEGDLKTALNFFSLVVTLGETGLHLMEHAEHIEPEIAAFNFSTTYHDLLSKETFKNIIAATEISILPSTNNRDLFHLNTGINVSGEIGNLHVGTVNLGIEASVQTLTYTAAYRNNLGIAYAPHISSHGSKHDSEMDSHIGRNHMEPSELVHSVYHSAHPIKFHFENNSGTPKIAKQERNLSEHSKAVDTSRKGVKVNVGLTLSGIDMSKTTRNVKPRTPSFFYCHSNAEKRGSSDRLLKKCR